MLCTLSSKSSCRSLPFGISIICTLDLCEHHRERDVALLYDWSRAVSLWAGFNFQKPSGNHTQPAKPSNLCAGMMFSGWLWGLKDLRVGFHCSSCIIVLLFWVNNHNHYINLSIKVVLRGPGVSSCSFWRNHCVRWCISTTWMEQRAKTNGNNRKTAGMEGEEQRIKGSDFC